MTEQETEGDSQKPGPDHLVSEREDWVNAIHTGDAFDILPELPDESIHAVVTDPPYGLAFMGRDWDDFEPKEYQEWCEEWAREAKRVLKHGGHLLAFSGNRTHHRAFVGIEDAGFEIRDTLTWHYGTGFPKASDVSKTIDKRADAEREVVGKREYAGGHVQNSNEMDRPIGTFRMTDGDAREETEPATDDAEKWDGWKTGLKPATEFVVMARKPYNGATVDAVLEHGTGALNIDGTRIGCGDNGGRYGEDSSERRYTDDGSTNFAAQPGPRGGDDRGRYPANVVFDETAADALDAEVGELPKGGGSARGESGDGWGMNKQEVDDLNFSDEGGPSRYFYTSKASRSERTNGGAIENDHPTVKPRDLMEWLIKMVTREGQIVVDPFAGSGTTCMAAKGLNRQFVGIEQQAKWADVARVRAGLTPDDPSVVRDDQNATGLEDFA